MKKLFTLFALALFAMLFTPEAKASHMAGVDITYEYTGIPNTYLVRLKFYRDCTGIPAPGSVTICYASTLLGLSGSVTAPNISVTPVPSTPCVTVPSNPCPGGIGDIEEHVYEATVTLPQPGTDWVFSWADCCRNGAITTLQPNGMYISCTLDNITAPTNSSPSFLNLAYTRFCVGNQFFYDQGATDIDGDSLVFSLVTAEDGNFGCPQTPFPNTYIAPYSPTNPLASSIPITINSTNGVINFIPSVVQVAVICVLVREYRNGVLIGQVKRDIQINIVPTCNQIIPSFANNVLTAGGGQLLANCNDYSVIIPFDTTFQCASAVPTDLRVITPFGVPNPVVSVQPINCTNGQTDSLLVTFLNPLTVGETFVWIKRGFDGNTLLSECGAEIPEFVDTVRILVNDNSVWGPITDSVGCLFNDFTITLSDSIYCFSVANDGTDLQLVDGSGNNYPIANAYGYCTPNGLKTNQLLVEMASSTSAAGPLYLILTSGGSDGNTLANDCGRFLLPTDTLAILYVDNIIPINLGTDQNICSFDPIPTLDCGYANLSYQWYDQNGAIAGATAQTYTPAASGSYSVVVSNGPGCTGTDTLNLTIIPAPTDNLGNDLTLCINDPLPTLDAGNPGATFQWYVNGTIIPGATSQTYTPAAGPAGTYTYTVEVNTGNVLCIGSFDLVITTTSVFAVSLSDQTICDNATFPLLDAGNPGAPSYQWLLNGTAISGANAQTYQTTQAGTYSVQVGTGACAGTASMILTVNQTPVITLNDASICDYDAIPTLNAGNFANASYQWLANGSPIPGATGQTYQPSAAGTYSVDVTVPPGCTATDGMTLTINAAPVLAVADQEICALPAQTATLDAGVSGASYQWSNGASSQVINPNTSGNYIVTVTLNNCSAIDTAVVTVYSYPTPVVACNPGTGTYKFIYVWAAVTGASSYEVSEDGGATWIPANVPSGPESHGVNVTIPDFTVRVIGPGPLNCRSADSEPVACEVEIPNIFTPNGDNTNEFFELKNIEQYPNNTVQIFNRWGKEVFNAGGYNNSNKKFDGKDLPDGVYFYIVDLGDGKEPKAGTVTINR